MHMCGIVSLPVNVLNTALGQHNLQCTILSRKIFLTSCPYIVVCFLCFFLQTLDGIKASSKVESDFS